MTTNEIVLGSKAGCAGSAGAATLACVAELRDVLETLSVDKINKLKHIMGTYVQLSKSGAFATASPVERLCALRIVRRNCTYSLTVDCNSNGFMLLISRQLDTINEKCRDAVLVNDKCHKIDISMVSPKDMWIMCTVLVLVLVTFAVTDGSWIVLPWLMLTFGLRLQHGFWTPDHVEMAEEILKTRQRDIDAIGAALA